MSVLTSGHCCPAAGQWGSGILSTLMTIDTVDGELYTHVALYMMEVILLTVTFGTVNNMTSIMKSVNSH